MRHTKDLMVVLASLQFPLKGGREKRKPDLWELTNLNVASGLLKIVKAENQTTRTTRL